MLLFPSPWSFSWSFVFVFPTCFNFWNIVGCFCSTDLDNKIFVQSNGAIKIIAKGAGDDLGLRDVKLWSLDACIQMPDLWSLACATVTLQLQSIQDDVLIHRVLTHFLKFQRCVSPVQVVFSIIFSAAFAWSSMLLSPRQVIFKARKAPPPSLVLLNGLTQVQCSALVNSAESNSHTLLLSLMKTGCFALGFPVLAQAIGALAMISSSNMPQSSLCGRRGVKKQLKEWASFFWHPSFNEGCHLFWCFGLMPKVTKNIKGSFIWHHGKKKLP